MKERRDVCVTSFINVPSKQIRQLLSGFEEYFQIRDKNDCHIFGPRIEMTNEVAFLFFFFWQLKTKKPIMEKVRKASER